MDDTVMPLREAKRRVRADAPANPGYRPPILDVVDPVTLQGQPIPDRRWLVQDWIPRGSLTMLGGDGGLGKTLLAQMLATAATANVPWLGLHVEPMKCLAIFCEDDEPEIMRRQDAINRHLDIDFADLSGFAWQSRVGEDNAIVDYAMTETGFGKGLLEPTDLYRSIRRYINENGVQLLILDSLHDLFVGNENSRPEVRRFTQFLTGIALDMGGAVVLTSHPSLSGLNSGSGMSGSTAWNNAVRSRLYLARPESDQDDSPDDDARILSRKKSNYAKANETIPCRWRDGVFVRDDSPVGFVETLDKRAQESRAEEAFLAALDEMTDSNIPLSVSPNASNFAPKRVRGWVTDKPFRIKDYQSAMIRLLKSGTIENAPYGSPSKNLHALRRKAGNDA